MLEQSCGKTLTVRKLLTAMQPQWHTRPAQTCMNIPGGDLNHACIQQGRAFCGGALRGLGVANGPPVAER